MENKRAVNRKLSKIPCLSADRKIKQQAEFLSEVLKGSPKPTPRSHYCSNLPSSRLGSESSFVKSTKKSSLSLTDSDRTVNGKKTSLLRAPCRAVQSATLEKKPNLEVRKDVDKPNIVSLLAYSGTFSETSMEELPNLGSNSSISEEGKDCSEETQAAENEMASSRINLGMVASIETLAGEPTSAGDELQLSSQSSNSDEVLTVLRAPKVSKKFAQPEGKAARKVPSSSVKSERSIGTAASTKSASTVLIETNVKETLMKLVTNLPRNWVNTANRIAISRNDIMSFLAGKGLVSEAERFTAETTAIRQEVENAKAETQEKIAELSRCLNYVLENNQECNKLKQTIKAQNTKIMTLNFQLKTAENSLKANKARAESEKSVIEAKCKQLQTDAANSKRAFVKQLKEKAAALQKAVTDVATFKDEVEKLEVQVQNMKSEKISPFASKMPDDPTVPGSPVAEVEKKEVAPESLPAKPIFGFDVIALAERIDATKPRSPPARVRPADDPPNDDRSTRKQLKMFKSTVKKLEKTVETLSAQNAELRSLVSTSERLTSLHLDGVSEGGVAHALTTILHDKHRDVEKLAAIVRMMQRHCTSAQVQRTHLECRLAMLTKQVKASHI